MAPIIGQETDANLRDETPNSNASFKFSNQFKEIHTFYASPATAHVRQKEDINPAAGPVDPHLRMVQNPANSPFHYDEYLTSAVRAEGMCSPEAASPSSNDAHSSMGPQVVSVDLIPDASLRAGPAPHSLCAPPPPPDAPVVAGKPVVRQSLMGGF